MNGPVLGAWVIGDETAAERVRAFIPAVFTGEGRHRRRLSKMKPRERRYRSGKGI